jgi:hypothetical protein
MSGLAVFLALLVTANLILLVSNVFMLVELMRMRDRRRPPPELPREVPAPRPVKDRWPSDDAPPPRPRPYKGRDFERDAIDAG